MQNAHTATPGNQKSKTERAIDAIISMIRQNGWLKDHKLPSQRILANELGFSRPTIREAFASLEAHGIVVVKPARGAFLTDLETLERPLHTNEIHSVKTVTLAGRESQMYQFRYAVEPAVAELVAQNATDAQRKDLMLTSEEMKKALQNRDMEEFSRYDFIFHSQMIESANNRFFLEAITPFLDLFFESQKLPFETGNEGGETVREHDAIIACITARQAEQARAAMKRHIRGVACRAGIDIS